MSSATHVMDLNFPKLVIHVHSSRLRACSCAAGVIIAGGFRTSLILDSRDFCRQICSHFSHDIKQMYHEILSTMA